MKRNAQAKEDVHGRLGAIMVPTNTYLSEVQVTLGALSSIAPSPSGTCTDGDGTSLTLLAGVVRTDVSG